MQVHFLRIAAALILIIASVNGAKDVGPKTILPDDRLFQDQAAFCEGCYALIQEIHKLLSKWTKEKGSLEDHIDAAMVAICNTERLRSYVLSPPKMERLCSGLRAHYEEELGSTFVKHYGKKEPDVEAIFSDACQKSIPACPKNMKPMSVNRKEQREKDEAERAAKKVEKTSEEEKDKQDTKKEEKKKTKGSSKDKKKSPKSKSKSSGEHKKDEL